MTEDHHALDGGHIVPDGLGVGEFLVGDGRGAQDGAAVAGNELVKGGGCYVKEFEEVAGGETLVLPSGVGGLEVGHTIEVAQEIGLREHGRVDTFVAEFAQEAAVAIVDFYRDDTQVDDGIVSDVAVDMVIDFSFAQFAEEGATDEPMAIGFVVGEIGINLPADAIVAFTFSFVEGGFEAFAVFVVELSVCSGEKDFAVDFVGRDGFDNMYKFHKTASRRDAVSSP